MLLKPFGFSVILFALNCRRQYNYAKHNITAEQYHSLNVIRRIKLRDFLIRSLAMQSLLILVLLCVKINPSVLLGQRKSCATVKSASLMQADLCKNKLKKMYQEKPESFRPVYGFQGVLCRQCPFLGVKSITDTSGGRANHRIEPVVVIICFQ